MPVMTRKSRKRVQRQRKAPARTKVAGNRTGAAKQAGALPSAAFDLDGLPLDVDQRPLTPVEVLPPATPVPMKANVTAPCALVAAAFRRATDATVRRQLKRRAVLAIVILVPATDWIEPVMTLFIARFGAAWHPVENNTGFVTDLLRAERNAQVAINISRGQATVGIATQADALPATLTRAADLTIRIAAPDGVTIGSAIRIFSGARPPSGIDDKVALGLEFSDLVAAFRTRSSPAEIVARLKKTTSALRDASPGERLPRLEDAVEYGEARIFGLSVARDVADFKAGRIGWNETDRAVLTGESGLGKTFLCRIVAQACNAHFLSFSVAELFQNCAGSSLDAVIKASRAYFEKAAVLASSRSAGSGPSCCVLLLDEIDAVGNRANFGDPRERAWVTIFLTSVLLAIESAGAGVIILGATNNISAVDAALLRPGRLDRTIELKRPEHAGIVNILRHHLDGSLAGADLTGVGHLLAGSTAAEIMMAVRGARRIARNADRELEPDDLLQAVAPIEYVEPAALMRISLHEAAHAVASIAVPAGFLQRCSIGRQGGSPGRTIIRGETADLSTRDSIERRAVATLAGRAAEKLFLRGSIALGSGGDDSSDLALVTRHLASIHASTGLGGTLVYLVSQQEALKAVRADLNLRKRVEVHMRKLQKRADDVVQAHRQTIIAVAEQLRIRRHLSGDEIRSIFAATAPSAPMSRVTKNQQRQENP
jgi:cell division protease FtsH